MNVLFDLTYLAAWYKTPSGRTGVFRVADEVRCALAARPDCALRYAADGHVAEAADYLQAASGNLTDLVYPESARRLSALAAPARRLARRDLSDRRPVARLRRRLAATIARAADRLTSRLPADALAWADVYHSPVTDVHPQVDRLGTRRPVRFVTVYDLIALLFPQYYEPGQVETIRRSHARVADHWVLAISECTRRDLVAHCGCDPARVFVTPLAASEHFRPCRDPEAISRVRAACGIPPGPYVLSLCTLEPRKNLPFVIRAFARLVHEEKFPDLSLVLVGGTGWKTAALERALADLPDLRGRIVVTGFVPDPDLAALYSGALAFVYLSLYEGFGLPPLEAMQCGVPVVTSNTSSLPEVVGDAGQTVDPCDEDGFCAALGSLVRDPARRAAWAERSLARAAEFSWAHTAEKTVAAYRAALEAEGR